VTWRRIVPLALVVTALLAVVAFVAHGRPLGSGRGAGGSLPAVFWDYVFTTFLIVEVVMILAGLILLFLLRRDPEQRPSYQRRTVRSVATLVAIAVLVWIIGRHIDLNRLLHPHGSTHAATNTTAFPPAGGKTARHYRSPVQFRWGELAIVLGLLVALAAAAVATRRRLRPETQGPEVAPELLAAALDESLDDLREDPDLRRAIIAAYARMETALAAAGLRRHHAEAPLEYVERCLLTLETSAFAARRLTDLFEWARFSQHEPEPLMRDEAVEALVAVRDELRASVWVAA
jgi:heme/copper-type cytochrome/quinol oxidase subunit 2